MNYLKYRVDKRRNSQYGRISLNLVVFAVIIVLVLAHLIQVNSLVTTGYQIRDLQKILKEKEEASQKLEIEILKLQSVNNLQEAAKKINMVSVDKMKYLQSLEGEIAAR